MLSVNTNVSSLNAQRNLNNANKMMKKSLERLSSGLRINRAADDAAGLAISEGMTSQINGLNQAVRNTNDGVSLLNTAESALVETGNLLQRMRVLTVQAASDTNTDANRQVIQDEIDELTSEITRIADTVQFNGLSLLDGSFENKSLQVGAQAGQRLDLSIGDMRAKSLGGGEGEAASKITDTTTSYAAAAGDFYINGQSVITSDDGSGATNSDASAKAYVNAINSQVDGVTATAETTTLTAGADWADDGSNTLVEGDLKINGVDIIGETGSDIIVTTLVDEGANDLIDAINARSDETGVTVEAVGQKLKFSAADGRNIDIVTADTGVMDTLGIDVATNLDTAGANLDGSSGTQVESYGQYTITSDEEFTITGRNVDNAGFSASSAGTATVNTNQDVAITADLDPGDLVINGSSVTTDSTVTADQPDIGATEKANFGFSAYGVAKAISEQVNGVSASATTTIEGGVIGVPDESIIQTVDDTLDINGLTLDVDLSAATTAANVEDTLNAAFQTAKIGDLANYGDLDVTFSTTGTVGTNLQVIVTSNSGHDITLTNNGTDWELLGLAADTYKGEITLTSNEGDITIEGDSTILGNLGFEEGTTKTQGGTVEVTGSEGSTLASLNVTSVTGANTALRAIDAAIQQVSDQRSYFGAMTNRLESTQSNLRTVSENLSASRSQILDADFAEETAQLTKAQILQQAGTAILSQANMLPQQALSLLG